MLFGPARQVEQTLPADAGSAIVAALKGNVRERTIVPITQDSGKRFVVGYDPNLHALRRAQDRVRQRREQGRMKARFGLVEYRNRRQPGPKRAVARAM